MTEKNLDDDVRQKTGSTHGMTDDTLTRERNAAYATFLYQTGIAVEFIDDGTGFMWATGTGMDEIVYVTESAGERTTLPPGEFGDLLVIHDTVIMDRTEIEAFREMR